MRVRRRLYGFIQVQGVRRKKKNPTPGMRDVYISAITDRDILTCGWYRIRLHSGLPSAARADMIQSFMERHKLTDEEARFCVYAIAKEVKYKTRQFMRHNQKDASPILLSITHNGGDDAVTVRVRNLYDKEKPDED